MTAVQTNARRNRLLAEGALFLVSFLWVLRPIWSIDIFFHVAIGRELVANGIPSTDVFSAAHPDAPWTPFQVGYALFVYAIDFVGGLDLLRLVHSLLLGSVVVLLWRKIRGTTQSVWGALLLLALFFILFEERIRLRPHLFNLLFEVTVLIPFAAGTWRKSPKVWRGIILLTSLAWTFIHAMGSLWLLCVAGTVAVAGADSKERRYGWVACLLAFVGILASPGAVGGIIHVISISGDWSSFVPELAPSWIWFQYGSPYGFIAGCAPWLAVMAVIYAVCRNPERERWATIIAAAGLAFGAVWMVRLTYYSVFVFILLAPELTPLYDGLRERWGQRRLRFGHAILLLTVCLGTVLASQRIPPTVKRGVNPWTTTLDPGFFPVDEVAALKRAKVGTRIFNASVWGGYLLYHLYPQARVLTDGRITFLSDVKDTLKHANRRSRRVYVANLAHTNWKIDLLVWGPGMMRPNKHWDLIHKGKIAEVWAPRGAIADKYRAALKATKNQAP
jgi:hypothetical protein